MCGRFTLRKSGEFVAKAFNLPEALMFKPVMLTW
jgi:hypothetical protein